MSADEQELKWKIDNVRESISRDWKNLAMKNLTADERKAIREHFNICVSTLKGLVERGRASSKKLNWIVSAGVYPQSPYYRTVQSLL
jgi:hypothetical protein